jgi:hypothetical protein
MRVTYSSDTFQLRTKYRPYFYHNFTFIKHIKLNRMCQKDVACSTAVGPNVINFLATNLHYGINLIMNINPLPHTQADI